MFYLTDEEWDRLPMAEFTRLKDLQEQECHRVALYYPPTPPPIPPPPPRYQQQQHQQQHVKKAPKRVTKATKKKILQSHLAQKEGRSAAEQWAFLKWKPKASNKKKKPVSAQSKPKKPFRMLPCGMVVANK